jgi:hypothetical protein
VTAAERPVWWTDYGDEVVGGLAAHLAYEADATVERVYTVPFVPALLQTVDYTRAIFENMEGHFAKASFEDTEASSEEEVPKLINIRKRRQEVLDHRDGLEPLQLVAVMHESALRQSVGSAKILRDQLGALLEHSIAPNVSLHVLPFAASPVFTMTCMYAYFEYQGDNNLEQDVVHIETHAGFFNIEDPERVADYRKWHDALIEASLSLDGSRELIRAAHDAIQAGSNEPR